MKAYVLSPLAGILVGVVYSLNWRAVPGASYRRPGGPFRHTRGRTDFPGCKKNAFRSQPACGLEGGALQSTPVWVFAWPELRRTSTHGGSIV